MKKSESKGAFAEVEALRKVLAALGHLDEKQRNWVISAVSNLGLAPVGPVPPVGIPPGIGAAIIPGQPGTSAHARAFLKDKKPKNTVQQLACLAFYLTHYKDTPHFKTKDLSKMNSDAGGTRIGNTSQAVKNATYQSGYLGPAGGGKKLLTGFGEDVVNALPNEEAAKAVEAAKPRKRPPVTKNYSLSITAKRC